MTPPPLLLEILPTYTTYSILYIHAGDDAITIIVHFTSSLLFIDQDIFQNMYHSHNHLSLLYSHFVQTTFGLIVTLPLHL